MSTALYTPGIQTGFWRNYDHGEIHGATLTLSARHGGYLIAFLALYVSVTGAQVWVILRFVLHQLNNPRKRRNAFYAQQQLVLRNSEGTLNTAWRLFQVSWAWRRLESYSVIRSLHFILPAILVFASFFAGGIFSSEVSKAAGSSVLVKSNQCGVVDMLFEPGLDVDPVNLHAILTQLYNAASQILSASTYAQSCYASDTNRNQCSRYLKQQLNWTTTPNATCPFDENLCILNGTSSLRLDSGVIDSHSDLGINAPYENRVHYRKVTTCAPIHTEPFTSLRNSSFIGDDSSFLLKPALNDTTWGMMGPFQDFMYGASDGGNSTYSYNIQDSYNNLGIYDITAVGSFDDPDWTPISQLNRTDADIVLFFLGANSISYISPVDDPWFAAHRHHISNIGVTENTWRSDAFIQVLACADQYQICNPGTDQCSSLDSLQATKQQLQQIGLNDYQNQTAFIIMDIGAALFGTGAVFEALGSGALLATSQVVPPGVSFSLPDNQWMLEATWWFTIGLAGLQQSVVEYATGPNPDHLVDGQAIPLSTLGDPNSTVTRTICNSQMIKSNGGYQNFSVLGLCCILAIGGSIIIVSLYVESIVGFVQKKVDKGEKGRTRWMADSNFQVQRMMYEGRGYEKWKGQKDAVPVYLGGNLEFPAELEDGRFGLKKRMTTGQMSAEEDPKTKKDGVVKVVEASSRSETTTSLEVLAVGRDISQKDEVKLTTEAKEVSGQIGARLSQGISRSAD
ncbi:hypothetical protein N431DRAFT_350195 [Stipitochalara longipes BDJ]|nr:hypothetical protein N431DRAFT_350195 [Stipitochalara longipes BDJ]